MAGLFEDANKAVVEAAYINVEYTQTADGVAAAQDPPADVSDGINLRKSTRGVIFAKPSAGQTVSVKVWAYVAAIDAWFELTEAARVDIAADGDSWKINTGSASRIYIQVSAISGGTADVWYGRSYVE